MKLMGQVRVTGCSNVAYTRPLAYWYIIDISHASFLLLPRGRRTVGGCVVVKGVADSLFFTGSLSFW